MNLLGLNQNLASPSSADKLPVAGDNSQLSNQPSDKFKNTLNQISENSEKQSQYSSQADQSGLNQKQDLVRTQKFPVAHQPYRKPVQSISRTQPHQAGLQTSDPLVDEQIQSQFENNGELVAVSPKSATVDSLTRRAAIQSFMQKMETKLGIEPSEIVEAFQRLSLEELAAPPEQNVDKIISFLNLDVQQQQTARTFFDEMLTQSSAQSIADYLKATDRELSLSVMSQNQMRRERLQKGLATMNQQFFTQPQTSVQPVAKEYQQNQNQKVSPEFWAVGAGAAAAAVGREATSQMTAVGQNGASAPGSMTPQMRGPEELLNRIAMTQQPSFVDKSGVELGQEWSPVSERSQFNAADIEKMISAGKSSIGKNAYGLNTPVTPASQMPMLVSDTGQNSLGSGMEWLMPGAAAADGQRQNLTENSFQQSEGSSNEALQEMLDAGDLAEADGMEFHVKSEAAASATGSGSQASTAKSSPFMVTSQPTEAEQAQNVKDVVTHANLLVKKGGGEMKVALNPEGMGQVNLKVAVQDGQVSVEMVTESNEAKKILEKGLGDLKANLASHKLNVDNVKVDFSGEIAKQFDHAHDEAQRQSAQNFMEQFRHQNQSWRQNFFDIPAGKVTGHPNEGGPQDELTQIQSGKKKSSSRRLDLVA